MRKRLIAQKPPYTFVMQLIGMVFIQYERCSQNKTKDTLQRKSISI